jgi:light-regulated signal transduction histidine kinase (bacteriophytochrome)
MSELKFSVKTDDYKILLVDDTPENLQLLINILTRQGYKVRPASSGVRALSAVKIDPPDLILLDVMMPEMDGYMVCAQLKADEATRDIPVIFLSALPDAINKVKAFELGGVDYITKPFQVQEVAARVRMQLMLRESQKQLSQQNMLLQQLNQELVRSNQELEQFSYIVSHDLQQPLQGVLGFAKILQMKYQTQLDEEAIEYILRIVGAGERMQDLIQELLAYGQVTATFPLVPVDCNVVREKAIANLQLIIAERSAQLTGSELPTVMGNETQLVQLFQNLISNALKFPRPHVTLEIEISAESNAGVWLFRVQDNGIGIEPQDCDRIFELFQRLHPDREYPGTGIGLATCKKIVERHGGQIWVKSRVGLGSQFYFTLPELEQVEQLLDRQSS